MHGCPLLQLLKYGIPCYGFWSVVLQLLKCGYPLLQLLKCGYPMLQLLKCGYPLLQLLKCGYPMLQLLKCGYPMLQLLKCGYPLLQLLKCGYPLLQLLKCGYPLLQLSKCGYPMLQLSSLSCSLLQFWACSPPPPPLGPFFFPVFRFNDDVWPSGVAVSGDRSQQETGRPSGAALRAGPPAVPASGQLGGPAGGHCPASAHVRPPVRLHARLRGLLKPHKPHEASHTTSTAFRHIPPNSAGFSYATDLRAAVHRCQRRPKAGLGTNKTAEAT